MQHVNVRNGTFARFTTYNTKTWNISTSVGSKGKSSGYFPTAALLPRVGIGLSYRSIGLALNAS